MNPSRRKLKLTDITEINVKLCFVPTDNMEEMCIKVGLVLTILKSTDPWFIEPYWKYTVGSSMIIIKLLYIFNLLFLFPSIITWTKSWLHYWTVFIYKKYQCNICMSVATYTHRYSIRYKWFVFYQCFTWLSYCKICNLFSSH